jgi:hypothetical protein
VEDLEARLEKLLTDAEDCAFIAKRTTDGEARPLQSIGYRLTQYGIGYSRHDCVEARAAD